MAETTKVVSDWNKREASFRDDAMKKVIAATIDARENFIRSELVKLGWTPPEDVFDCVKRLTRKTEGQRRHIATAERNIEPRINRAGAGLVKISAKGKKLKSDAKNWDAVLDEVTGLMFAAQFHQTTHTWWDAVAIASRSRLCGFNDWRLTSRKEALSILDEARYEPAFDPAYFRFPNTGWFWTATKCAWTESSAWYVGLDGGSSHASCHGNEGLVLAVRMRP